LPYLLRDWTGSDRMSRTVATVPTIRIFGGHPEEIRNVRTFVGLAVRGCPVADDVVLLASEVATNAIAHTASGVDGTFAVSVHVQDGWVRTEVSDLGSNTAPAVRRSGSPEVSGAGLRIVDMLAHRWGFHGGPRGRVVWFEMAWK
jgi:Histidine kinase-like ATPase domain